MPLSVRTARTLVAALLLTPLAGCHRVRQEPEQAQRIALDKVPSHGEEPLPSPDTTGASWTASANGHALDFDKPGERPFLTLACNPATDPPQITIIRHVRSHAGEKALFPVIGHGRISRFKVDAAHVDGEWRWQGTLPADDPQLEVFDTTHDLEATLPGGGTVKANGSDAPGQFIAHCKEQGKAAG